MSSYDKAHQVRAQEGMSTIQKQCWDNYHAARTKKDFEELDKNFIKQIEELLKDEINKNK